ncbi:Surfeit locus 1 family protein [Sphingomonas sp. HMWF008]|nr:Surfeit locus 1 family protein [Sphingomonas sp. HMWF008]
MVAALVLLTAGFVALGIWQIERRAWKHALIASTERRIHAAATAPPGEREWPHISAARNAYTRVHLSGHFLSGKDVKVRAVSDLGSGYWVMTPLDTGRFILLVNRGFVPQGVNALPAPSGRASVTGLLRISEPGGGFLRANDPAGDRWYSRDVAAITQRRRLAPVAPYFVDADARAGAGYPIGGLTVVRFSDNHLVYALTWFALAAMSLAGLWWFVNRAERFGEEHAMMP